MLPLYLMLLGSLIVVLWFTIPTIYRRRISRLRESDAGFAGVGYGYWAYLPRFPEVYGWGRTRRQAWKKLVDAARAYSLTKHHV